MHPLLQHIDSVYQDYQNKENAQKMSAYMKNVAPFYGIKSPDRSKISLPFYEMGKQMPSGQLPNFLTDAFKFQKREIHYFALELYEKKLKSVDASHVPSLVKLLQTKSWWDTVDFIAARLIGKILLNHPDESINYGKKWVSHNNLWVNRLSLIFQLKFKSKTHKQLLFDNCSKLAHSNEFFIQKAIGWALREYAKTNPLEVTKFVSNHELKPLSKREALKNLST